MSDRVLIPLPGIGTVSLTREQYEAALIPNAPVEAQHEPPTAESLVSAKSLSAALSLPVSCIYEYGWPSCAVQPLAGARCAQGTWYSNSWSRLSL